MTTHRIEKGAFTNVTIPGDGTIIKTTGISFDFAQAEHISSATAEYADALALGGIPVARLISVAPHQAPDGSFRVRHVMEYIKGPSVFRLEEERRYAATRKILGSIANAPARPDDPDRLQYPVDYKLGNFIIPEDDPDGDPVLIDIYPPISWNDRGQVVLPDGATKHTTTDYDTRYAGYRAGAMSRIIVGAMVLARSDASYSGMEKLAKEQIQGSGDWYAHLLPPDLEETTRRAIHTAVREFLRDSVDIYKGRPLHKTAAEIARESLLHTVPAYSNARDMHPDELWATRNNGGKPQDGEYIESYNAVRQSIVTAFEAGSLYESVEGFEEILKDTHKFLAVTGTYNRLRTDGKSLKEEEFGVFNPEPGRIRNARLTQSRRIAELAARYGDPYGADKRLYQGEPDTESRSTVLLPGISPDNLPFDTVRYDSRGKLIPPNDDYSIGGYEFEYADVEGAREYTIQMQQLGKTIESLIKGDVRPDSDTVLDLIARQYQYGACVRPFRRINNSILMQLVNTQIKLLGLPGMTHGEMDIAAQRLQPDTFARYFIARAKGIEP